MKRRIIIILIGVAAVILIVSLFLVNRSRISTSVQIDASSSANVRQLYRQAKQLKAKKDFAGAIINLNKIMDASDDPKLIQTVLYDLADAYKQNNQLLEAKNCLDRILLEFPDSELTDISQKELGPININILFSPIETKDSRIYVVKPGDNLYKISQKFNAPIDLIRKSNRLTSDLLRPDMRLKMPQANFSILVIKSKNRLILKSSNNFFKMYTVSTGNNDLTPAGEFTIANKLENPVWYYEGKVIPAGSAENILGTRWLGLSLPKYGIHGTNDPSTIGKYVTKGCVRMVNQDVEELYTIVPTGTKVTVIE